MSMQARASTDVVRRIFFYRADAGTDKGGRPLPFDPSPVLLHIRSLNFDTNGRYWRDADGRDLCCWPEEYTGRPRCVAFGRVRRSGLPHVESGGKISRLPISATSGLLDTTHIVFFENNIVGAEFNYYGPRATRLAQYLCVKAPNQCNQLAFVPLLRNDVSDQLKQLRGVTAFHIKVRSSYLTIIEEASHDFGAALRLAADASEAEVIDIVLKPRPRSGHTISRRMIDMALGLLNRKDIREEVKKFTITGFTGVSGETDTVDVLSDHLIATENIFSMNGSKRTLESSRVYEAITKAHQELKPDLERAAEIIG